MWNTAAAVSVLTTFLGAFLALGLTYIYDRHKAKTAEREERAKVLRTIRHELNENLERIRRYFTSEEEAYAALEAKLNIDSGQGVGYLAVTADIRLERTALQTAIFSGRLFLLAPEILEALYENYRRIDVVNQTSDDIRAIARNPVSREHAPMIQSLVTVRRGYLENLRDSLPGAVSTLAS
jgi:hypothetical protein